MKNIIRFLLNGVAAEATCRPDMTVLEWLRGDALLRGTKEGCAEGDCGACSVLIKRENETTHQPVNSCIMLMGQLHGSAIITVEGLAALGDDGHTIQSHMAENGSSQCGFCTPGIVASLAGLLDKNDSPTDSDIHDALAGNLCRCTGYRPIVEAAQAAAKSGRMSLPDVPLDAGAHEVGHEDCIFHLPASLTELLDLRSSFPDATLLGGGTDLNLDIAHARSRWPRTIFTGHVTELRKISESETHISIGGAVTWEEALLFLQKYWPSFATLVRRFGSTQIRSMGTIAGNLANASPIGDGAPALLALDAQLTLANSTSDREIALDEFFLGYRKSALQPSEIIREISIPLPSENQQFRVYKISKRYDQDISTVCGAFNLEFGAADKITSARTAFGGMAATPMRSTAAELALIGNQLDANTVSVAKEAIDATFTPMDDMRGTARYRSVVAANLVDRLVEDLAGNTVEVMAL